MNRKKPELTNEEIARKDTISKNIKFIYNFYGGFDIFEKLGFSKSTVDKYRTNQPDSNIKTKELEKLCEFLCTTKTFFATYDLSNYPLIKVILKFKKIQLQYGDKFEINGKKITDFLFYDLLTIYSLKTTNKKFIKAYNNYYKKISLNKCETATIQDTIDLFLSSYNEIHKVECLINALQLILLLWLLIKDDLNISCLDTVEDVDVRRIMSTQSASMRNQFLDVYEPIIQSCYKVIQKSEKYYDFVAYFKYLRCIFGLLDNKSSYLSDLDIKEAGILEFVHVCDDNKYFIELCKKISKIGN